MAITEEIEITKLTNMNDELFDMAKKGEWDKVVDIYRTIPEAQTAKFSNSGDTALHIAVSEGKKKIVKQLIHQIISSKEGRKEALEIKNNEGNTPLHVALSKGNEAMCQLIAGLYPPLVGVGNANRETPIFLAVQDGKKEAFLKLLKGAIEGDTSGEEEKEGKEEKNGKDVAEESIRNFLFHMARKGKWDEVVKIYEWTPLAHKTKITNSGDTALHIAVSHDNKERVEELIKEIISNGEEGKEALKVKNEQGNTPLHVAASMGSVRMCECIAQVDPSLVAVRNKNGETPLFVTALYGQQKAFLCLLAACDTKDICEGSRRNDGDTILHVALAGDYFGSGQLSRIVDVKQKHTWSVQIMKELIKNASSYEYGNTGTTASSDSTFVPDQLSRVLLSSSTGEGSEGEDKNGEGKGKQKLDTPILIAAKNGITEIVEKILNDFQFAIHDISVEKKNMVQLAVENRQLHVYELLRKRNISRDSMFRVVDSEGNSVLHLAANLGDSNPWLIPGAALQMQWEIKWYEFVKDSMPLHFFPRYNNQGKTSEELFTETHKVLVKEGGEWLKKTSESFSVVAALIATVAFATSSTVPGGFSQESGTPTFGKHPAFSISAISSIVALCFSVTAVVMFLAILTSRYQERDFGRDLPGKLLVGLTSLFLSIASMLVSFCATDYFVLKDNLKYVVFPVYAAMCLPVTFFALVQLPLYLDLIHATFKNVPQRKDKAVPL